MDEDFAVTLLLYVNIYFYSLCQLLALLPGRATLDHVLWSQGTGLQ